MTQEEFYSIPVEKMIFLPNFVDMSKELSISGYYFKITFRAWRVNDRWEKFGQEIETPYFTMYKPFDPKIEPKTINL
jgi:hypothetical protein